MYLSWQKNPYMDGLFNTNHTSFLCFINTHLNYDGQDSPRAKNTFQAEAAANITAWKALSGQSRESQFVHYPKLCLFNQVKYISPSVPPTLNFQRSNEKKSLRKVTDAGAGDGYKILTSSCTLLVQRVLVYPGIEMPLFDHCETIELEVTMDEASAGQGWSITMDYERGLYA